MRKFLLCLAFIPSVALSQIKYPKKKDVSNDEKKASYFIDLGFNELNNKLDYKKAIEYANSAMELDYKNHLSYYIRGEAFSFLNNRDMAISDLSSCLKFDPSFSPAYASKALLEELDDKNQALQDYSKAIKYCKENKYLTNYYSSRSSLRIDLLDWTGAENDINIAIRLDKTNTFAYTTRARVYIENGDYKSAINDCNKAISFIPGQDAFSYYYRGIAKAKLGNTESACNDFSKAKEILGSRQFVEAIEKYCH